MIFTYKNKKYASALRVGATTTKSIEDASLVSIKGGYSTTTKIKYNMFAPINIAGCNYCGTK
jgi:hypothetical protein